MLPEIVFFSEPEDFFFRNTDLFVPDVKGFVVILVYRRIQSLRIQSDRLGQELPAPGKSFFFKIITKGEIPQHFEEGTVTGRLSNVLDVARTDTFLAGSHTGTRRNLRSRKIRFQRRHSCIDQQKALISLRNQREAFHHQMAFALHKIQEHLTKFVDSIFFHDCCILLILPLLCGISFFLF